jgi:adenosylhomocysteine nucleosidase
MKTLVTFAVGTEFAAWRRQRGFRQIARQPFALYAAEIGGNPVRVLLTGIGAEAASRALSWALSSPTDLCIASGFAGALRPCSGIGEVLAARVVRRAGRELAVASDHELMAVAVDAGARRVDRFLTSERLVVSAAEKSELAGDADAVEMESFVIMAEAARHGVRAVAVRAVSDTADSSLPYDFDRVRDDQGKLRFGGLLLELARQPQRVPGLLRLARDCRLAAGRLAVFLDAYLALLSARQQNVQEQATAVTA